MNKEKFAYIVLTVGFFVLDMYLFFFDAMPSQALDKIWFLIGMTVVFVIVDIKLQTKLFEEGKL